jgi:amidase
MHRLAQPVESTQLSRASPLSDVFVLGSGDFAGAVKGNFDIAGLPTGMGSRAFAGAAPASDHAVAVAQLIAAGCRIVGRTKMHELAFGVSGINDWQGTPANPRWPERIPGGSSSGSAAAVAAGLVDFALGTDTGGSTREPAACCGIVGFKPSFGTISRTGVRPRHSSLDCVGIFAGDVGTVARVMAILDPGFEVLDPLSIGNIGLIVAEADPAIGEATTAAVARIGAQSVPVALDQWAAAYHAGMTLIGAEMWQEFGQNADLIDRLGDDVRARLRAASAISPVDTAEAETVRTRFAAEVDRALDRVDVLALPTLPQFPPTLDEARNSEKLLRLTANIRPFNLSGHPAISIPIPTASGLPAGLQLIAHRGDDAHLCAVARFAEHRISSFEGCPV